MRTNSVTMTRSIALQRAMNDEHSTTEGDVWGAIVQLVAAHPEVLHSKMVIKDTIFTFAGATSGASVRFMPRVASPMIIMMMNGPRLAIVNTTDALPMISVPLICSRLSRCHKLKSGRKVKLATQRLGLMTPFGPDGNYELLQFVSPCSLI